MRTAEMTRKTNETEVTVKLNVDGNGRSKVATGAGFLDHMLRTLSQYSMFDVEIVAKGDLNVDEHHTVEDVGLVLGQALNKALSDRKGMVRYGSAIVPMDDALALAAVDIGGRPYLQMDMEFKRERIGDVSTELFYDFFQAFSRSSQSNLAIKILTGRNEHHKIEAIFKALGLALRKACAVDDKKNEEIPSTKGVI